MHSFIHSCIHSFMHACIHAFLHSFIHAFMHSWIHSFIHACIRYFFWFVNSGNRSTSAVQRGRRFLWALAVTASEWYSPPLLPLYFNAFVSRSFYSGLAGVSSATIPLQGSCLELLIVGYQVFVLWAPKLKAIQAINGGFTPTACLWLARPRPGRVCNLVQ